MTVRSKRPTTHPDPCGCARKKCGCDAKPCGCKPTVETCGIEIPVRPRFVCDLELVDTDLTSLVEWTRSRLALQRFRDGWGIACGLDVVCSDTEGWVVIRPGAALSCCGDDLIVCEPLDVDLTACKSPRLPCDEYVAGSAGDDKANDPCGNIVVDLLLTGHEQLTETRLVSSCSSCGSRNHLEATRIRESANVIVRPVLAPADDPREYLAKQFQDAFELLTTDLQWDKGPQSVRSRLAEAEAPCGFWNRHCDDDFGAPKGDEPDPIAIPLMEFVTDTRREFLQRVCHVCESDGVPLARVRMRRRDRPVVGAITTVTLIDAARPHRREMRRDSWPVRAGEVSLAGYIGERWQDVCSELAALGVVRESVAANTIDQVNNWRTITGVLATSCDSSAPTAIVYRDPCRGWRILGFSEARERVDDAVPIADQPQAVSIVGGGSE
jgi:hypothetical protein